MSPTSPYNSNDYFISVLREPIYTLKAFDSLAGDGKPMADGSSDGYVTNKLFPWQHVPDIVPGRKGLFLLLIKPTYRHYVTLMALVRVMPKCN